MAKTALRNSLTMLAVMSSIILTTMSVTGSPKPQPIVISSTHYQAQKSSQASLNGKALFQREHCAVCHSIDSKGGCLAPPLDGIGAHRNQEFILARITDTAAEVELFNRLHPSGELLQHPRLRPDHAHLITTFLLTLPEPADGFRIGAHQKSQTEKSNPKEAIARQAEPAEPQISAEDIRRGREEFISHGCISCHSVNGLGGRFAPPLDGESGRRERPFVEERITNAQFFTKEFPDEYGERGLVMPPTDVSSKDIKQITDFIMSLPEIKSEHSDIQ